MALLARNTSPSGKRNAVSLARWLALFKDCSSCEMTSRKEGGREGGRKGGRGGEGGREGEGGSTVVLHNLANGVFRVYIVKGCSVEQHEW